MSTGLQALLIFEVHDLEGKRHPKEQSASKACQTVAKVIGPHSESTWGRRSAAACKSPWCRRCRRPKDHRARPREMPSAVGIVVLHLATGSTAVFANIHKEKHEKKH